MFNEQSNGSMDADPMSWEGIILFNVIFSYYTLFTSIKKINEIKLVTQQYKNCLNITSVVTNSRHNKDGLHSTLHNVLYC